MQQNMNKQNDMITLARKIKELNELNDQGRTLHSAIGALSAKLTGECRWIDNNIPMQSTKRYP